MRPLTLDESYKVISLYAVLMVVDELLVDLNGTPVFVQGTKQLASRLRKELERNAMPAVQEVFDIDNETMSELFMRASKSIPQFFKLKPEQWQIVCESAFVAEHPEWLKHRQLLAVLTQPDR